MFHARAMSFHSPTASFGGDNLLDANFNGSIGIGKRVTLFMNGSFVNGKGMRGCCRQRTVDANRLNGFRFYLTPVLALMARTAAVLAVVACRMDSTVAGPLLDPT